MRRDFLEHLRRWAQRNGHQPLSGYVCVFEDTPFRWSRIMCSSHTVVPGVICVDLQSGEKFTATGGDDHYGADRWRSEIEKRRPKTTKGGAA